MILIDAYVDAFKKYFDFKGEANRPAYWWFVLANIIVGVVLSWISGILYLVYELIVLIPALAIATRRIRNTGHSPWHMLWLLTGIGGIVVFVFTLLPSKKA